MGLLTFQLIYLYSFNFNWPAIAITSGTSIYLVYATSVLRVESKMVARTVTIYLIVLVNHRGKKPFFLRFSKVAGKKCITTVSKENFEKKVTTTMVET